MSGAVITGNLVVNGDIIASTSTVRSQHCWTNRLKSDTGSIYIEHPLGGGNFVFTDGTPVIPKFIFGRNDDDTIYIERIEINNFNIIK